jgi:hypothetical protein
MTDTLGALASVAKLLVISAALPLAVLLVLHLRDKRRPR